MKQSNRKPLFLALALTFAAPLAFAQSTDPQTSNPQSTDPQSTTTAPTQPTQDASTQSTTQSTTQDPAATQSTDPTAATQSSTTGPQKKNWSDLDIDKNGTLSASEAAPVNSLSKSFSTADANADGELTQDEYKAFLAAGGKEKVPGSGN